MKVKNLIILAIGVAVLSDHVYAEFVTDGKTGMGPVREFFSLPLPDLEGPYGGGGPFGGPTFRETEFTFGHGFLAISDGWVSVEGTSFIPFPTLVGYLDGNPALPGIALSVQGFIVDVPLQSFDTLLDGQGIVGLEATVRDCFDCTVRIDSATLQLDAIVPDPATIAFVASGGFAVFLCTRRTRKVHSRVT